MFVYTYCDRLLMFVCGSFLWVVRVFPCSVFFKGGLNIENVEGHLKEWVPR